MPRNAINTTDCEVCGNEIPSGTAVCPFCRNGPSEEARSTPARYLRTPIRTLNIKADRPTVEEGLARLKNEMHGARQAGIGLARIIHGYGSRGKGGELRLACRAFLTREKQCRRIRSFIEGEQYAESNAATRALRKRYPELARSRRTDTGNPGITWVEL